MYNSISMWCWCILVWELPQRLVYIRLRSRYNHVSMYGIVIVMTSVKIGMNAMNFSVWRCTCTVCTLVIFSLCPNSCLQCFDTVGWAAGRHLACKNWVVGCWNGHVYGSRRRFAYDPADATVTHYLLLQLIQIGFTFLVPTHPGSPGQNPRGP